MTRYHVDTPAKLALVQVALDQSFGLRDVAGNPTPREQMVTFDGGSTFAPASVALTQVPHGGMRLQPGQPHACYTQPGVKWPLIDGGDGTAALQIPDTSDFAPANAAAFNALLGTTVSGVALPNAAGLVQVTRPRDSSLLPAGVRDKLDDAYVDSVLDGTDASGQPNDTAQARAAIRTELQGRGNAALARKDARNSQAALAQATGLGKAGG